MREVEEGALKKLVGVIVVVLVLVVGVFASGWAPRQAGSPSGRLVGHWIETDAGGLPQRDLGAHWYFAPPGPDGTGVLVVAKKNGVQERGSWTILEDRAAKDQVKLELERANAKEVWVVDVAKKGDKATISAEALIVKVKVSGLAYVDATTSPAVWSAEEFGHRIRRFASGL